MFVDSHCHLDRLDYEKVGELSTVLDSARNRGVEKFLCIATHLDGYDRIAAIAKSHDDVRITAGIHPLQKHVANVDADRLRVQVSQEKTVAVGETGLDYYYAADTAEAQRASFATHVQIAVEANKPLVIHTRDAVADTLAILKDNQADKCGGTLHCFTESLAMAEAALDIGFYISFSGILTFKSAEGSRL